MSDDTKVHWTLEKKTTNEIDEDDEDRSRTITIYVLKGSPSMCDLKNIIDGINSAFHVREILFLPGSVTFK